MGTPSSQAAAGWVKDDLDTTAWVPLKDILFRSTKKRLSEKPDDDIWEYVEANLHYVAECLRNIASECVSDGSISAFEIDNEQSPYVRMLPSLPTPILSRLRRIDPFDLEGICAKLLSALGAESSVTQKTNDGGVDFIAVNLKIVPRGLTIPLACHAAVIGQTKRYQEGNTISETKVREFVGAATLRRHELLRDGRLGPFTPVIFAYWTTSDFDLSAKRFAREMGLWYMDGLTLASYVSGLGLENQVASL